MLDCMTTYFIVDAAIQGTTFMFCKESCDQGMFQRSDQVTYRIKYTLLRLLGRISIDKEFYHCKFLSIKNVDPCCKQFYQCLFQSC